MSRPQRWRGAVCGSDRDREPHARALRCQRGACLRQQALDPDGVLWRPRLCLFTRGLARKGTDHGLIASASGTAT